MVTAERIFLLKINPSRFLLSMSHIELIFSLISGGIKNKSSESQETEEN